MILPQEIPRLELFMQVYDMRNVNYKDEKGERDANLNYGQLEEDILNNRY
jgi:hypothetical protein